MKKITSILMLFCAFVGMAWAQEVTVTAVENLSNDKCYAVQTWHKSAWTYNPSKPTMMSSIGKAGQTYDVTNTNQHYAFLKYNDKFYLYSVAAQKFVNNDGRGTKFVEYPDHFVTIIASHDNKITDGYPFVVALNGTNHIGISDGYGDQQGVITFWNDINDQGNAVKLTEAASFNAESALAKINLGHGAQRNALLAAIAEHEAEYNALEDKTTDGALAYNEAIQSAKSLLNSSEATAETLTQSVVAMGDALVGVFYVKYEKLAANTVYRIKNKSIGRYMAIAGAGNDGIKIKDYAENCNQLFYITPVEGETNKFTMRNVDEKYVACVGHWTMTSQDAEYQFEIETTSIDGIYKFMKTHDMDTYQSYGGRNIGPNDGVTADGSILYSNHGSGRANCEWVFEAVDFEVYKNDIAERISKVCYEPSGAVGVCDATDAEKSLLAAGVEGCETFESLVEVDKTLNKVLATAPTLSAGYYFIKGTGTGNNASWYATYGANGTDFMASSLGEGQKLGAKHVWSFETIAGQEGYKLKSCNLGKYARLAAAPNTSQITSDYNNGYKFTFTNNGAGKFIIKDGNGNVMRTENDGRVNYWGTENQETWYLFPATELEVEVASSYGSIYLPFDVTLADDQKVYAVTATSETSATLTEMSDIPAGEGAILAEGTYTLNIAEATSDWKDNMLEGTNVNTYIEGPAYVLGRVNVEGEEVVALAMAALNKKADGTDGTTHFLNNANKAYLPKNVQANVLRFNFGGNTTAIESVVAPSFDANAPIYDLSGRRVVNAVKGGLYIQNGKKFIVK